MSIWREEFLSVIKTKSEREAEDAERHRLRIEAALHVAREAMELALEGLGFAKEQLEAKEQPVTFAKSEERHVLSLHEHSLSVELATAEAKLIVAYKDGRPRDFDFANDKHLSARDVEEYVGRRVVELVRAAQKAQPW